MHNDTKNGLVPILVIVACFIGGSLAGGNIYRYVIEVPAWQHLQIISWSKYSQYADLRNGLYLFPIEAIGSALPLVLASAIYIRTPAHKPLPSLFISTTFSILGLVLTFLAAPIMLNVPKIGGDPLLIQQAFDKFHFWGKLRAMAQVLSFFFCVLALASIYKLKSSKEERTLIL